MGRARVDLVGVLEGRGRELEESARDVLVLLGLLDDPEDLLEHDAVRRESAVDLRLAVLDAPRDGDLALAVEELHGAHLAQVHPDGVVRLLDGGRVGNGRLGPGRSRLLRGLLRDVDDFDPEVAEPDVDLVELLRSVRELLGQRLVDLVVQEIPALLAEVDQRPDFGVFFFYGHRCLTSMRSGLSGALLRFVSRSRL